MEVADAAKRKTEVAGARIRASEEAETAKRERAVNTTVKLKQN